MSLVANLTLRHTHICCEFGEKWLRNLVTDISQVLAEKNLSLNYFIFFSHSQPDGEHAAAAGPSATGPKRSAGDRSAFACLGQMLRDRDLDSDVEIVNPEVVQMLNEPAVVSHTTQEDREDSSSSDSALFSESEEEPPGVTLPTASQRTTSGFKNI